jgi:hypothetical protein
MALKMDEKDDAANDFWTASKAYKLEHPECKVQPVLFRKSARLTKV